MRYGTLSSPPFGLPSPISSLFTLAALTLTLSLACYGWAGQRIKVSIESTADGSLQPCYVILPRGFDPQGKPVPLLVSLHSWSADVEQRNEATKRPSNAWCAPMTKACCGWR